jgi:hypothetical protein
VLVLVLDFFASSRPRKAIEPDEQEISAHSFQSFSSSSFVVDSSICHQQSDNDNDDERTSRRFPLT